MFMCVYPVTLKFFCSNQFCKSASGKSLNILIFLFLSFCIPLKALIWILIFLIIACSYFLCAYFSKKGDVFLSLVFLLCLVITRIGMYILISSLGMYILICLRKCDHIFLLKCFFKFYQKFALTVFIMFPFSFPSPL